MKLSCLSPSLPQIKPELLADIAQALNADGCRLLIFAKHSNQRAQIFSYGCQPHGVTPIEKTALWQDICDPQTTTVATSSITGVYPIDRIWEHPILAPLLIAFATAGIQSLLILPLIFQHQCVGCLTLFRTTSLPGWIDSELQLADRLVIDMCLSIMQQQFNQIWQDRSFYDLLTGLPHRILLDQWLSLALAKITSGQFLAVILIDLDRFKNINDSFGHRFGDRLLKLIATRLKSTLGEIAIVGRWSGNEFAIFVPDLSELETVNQVADQILDCFDQPFAFEQNLQGLKPNSLYIKIKMGITIATSDDADREKLIQQVNIALDRNQNNGKNSYEIYPPVGINADLIGIDSPREHRLRVEHILDRAIVDRQLFLHYQPQVDIQTGNIVGIEALLRCRDAQSKIINPADFIPIAEETGSIIQLGEWVIRAACQQSKLWQEKGLGSFPIAVNFSVKQLQDRHLIDTIAAILAETNVAPAALEVEITESIAIQDLDLTISILESLREIGVKISLDDFGTGYSSLAALKYLPLDRLKIDRSFIRELKLNTVDASIVNTIVNLGHELNLNVVAEGVETIEQFELLRSINCDAVQGFFFSRPLTAIDFETMITTGSYWHQNLTHPNNSHSS
jgi:diguanylate cyclase (GGDEF)-like protein